MIVKKRRGRPPKAKPELFQQETRGEQRTVAPESMLIATELLETLGAIKEAITQKGTNERSGDLLVDTLKDIKRELVSINREISYIAGMQTQISRSLMLMTHTPPLPETKNTLQDLVMEVVSKIMKGQKVIQEPQSQPLELEELTLE